uniref:Uncharacterized protein n=1 Tax=uncultured bacterium fosmid pJB39A3 TaxID=1478063 RepID=A0A0H3U7R4_9BACT|nr:hypothetical protein [uncultured bacterium fosmid pJB39A3]
MKKNLIISIIAGLICVSLVLVGSYSWVANNKRLKSDNMEVQLDYSSIAIASFNVYKYDLETNTYIRIDDGEYSLAPYDSIFKERNVNTPLVFEVKIKGKLHSPLDISFNCSSKVPKDHYTSNIVYVKGATGGTIGVSSEDPETIFKTVTEFFASDASPEQKQFLTAEKKGNEWVFGEKKQALDFEIALTEEEVEGNELTVYFIVDYDDTLVQAQGIANFSDITILQNRALPYHNDITQIRFLLDQ